MKAVADNGSTAKCDFYSSTLAPINRRQERPFCCWDMAVLTVLFLEMAVLMRLFLAK